MKVPCQPMYMLRAIWDVEDDHFGTDLGLRCAEVCLTSSAEDNLLAGASSCWKIAGGDELQAFHVKASQTMLSLASGKGGILIEAVGEVPVVRALDLLGPLHLVLSLPDCVRLVAHLSTLLVRAVFGQLLELVRADVVDSDSVCCELIQNAISARSCFEETAVFSTGFGEAAPESETVMLSHIAFSLARRARACRWSLRGEGIGCLRAIGSSVLDRHVSGRRSNRLRHFTRLRLLLDFWLDFNLHVLVCTGHGSAH